MATLDEILDGEVVPRWESKERGRMLVPEKLLEQWLLPPGGLWRLYRLFEEKLNESLYLMITPEMIKWELPARLRVAWTEATNKGWVSGDIPPFHFEQDEIDRSRIGLVWEGRMVAVNFAGGG